MHADTDENQIEEEIIGTLLGEADAELIKGNISDAIGLLGVALDLYPQSEFIRNEIPLVFARIRQCIPAEDLSESARGRIDALEKEIEENLTASFEIDDAHKSPHYLALILMPRLIFDL